MMEVGDLSRIIGVRNRDLLTLALEACTYRISLTNLLTSTYYRAAVFGADFSL
jgi:hypothetical protein